MNYKKLILVGLISAFVALLTSVMGVAGTIIGSVITSVLYNMLTEALDEPVAGRSFNANFEWDIAYIFPIAVITIIQILLIFALLAEMGILPYAFHNAFLSLQQFADNNLYRLLGIALIVISVYPFILRAKNVKKEHGAIIAFVGLIFLARGFVDLGNRITHIYDDVFIHFDLPIAIIALLLLVFVMVRILMSAVSSDNVSKAIKPNNNGWRVDSQHGRANGSGRVNGKSIRVKHKPVNRPHKKRKMNEVKQSPKVNNHNVNFKGKINRAPKDNTSSGFNKSSGDIQFESNDLLDDYK